MLGSTEHACDPNNEAKAERWLQVQGLLDALSQPPYFEKCLGAEGDLTGVSCASSCNNDSLFVFFLPAPSFTDQEQYLLCAMAMTPDRGVMMRFCDCWGLWWERLWIFVKVLTGGSPPPDTVICWREQRRAVE